jgi:hypothetical protein
LLTESRVISVHLSPLACFHVHFEVNRCKISDRRVHTPRLSRYGVVIEDGLRHYSQKDCELCTSPIILICDRQRGASKEKQTSSARSKIRFLQPVLASETLMPTHLREFNPCRPYTVYAVRQNLSMANSIKLLSLLSSHQVLGMSIQSCKFSKWKRNFSHALSTKISNVCFILSSEHVFRHIV